MATVRDMLEANEVISGIADNPNLFITASFKLLPIFEFLSSVAEDYKKAKDSIVSTDKSPEEKAEELNEYLDAEIPIPEITIGVNSLRNCNLTLRDLQKLQWWVVEFEDEYED